MSLKKTKLTFLFIILNSLAVFSAFLFVEVIYELQFSNSEYFKNKALSYREKTEIIEARRGSILDKNYSEIANSINAFNIGIYPNKIIDKEELSQLLSPLLKLDSKKIYEKLNSQSNYVYLKRNLDYEAGSKIKKWNYPGINVESSTKRIVYADSLRNIIGHVDPDGNGIEGLELYFDNTLKGVDGELNYEAAPNGEIIPQGEINTLDPIHGEDLILSIDSKLQYITGNLCEEALETTEAFKCSVVFANADTGEIIISSEKSSLNNKYFDINLISGRATYEPGSALKIFTIGSLLESEAISEGDSFLVEDKIEIINGSCDNNYDGLKGCYKDFLNHEPYELSVKEIIERLQYLCLFE